MVQSPFRGAAEVDRDISTGQVPPVDNYYLLVIGIDTYPFGFNPLNNAERDANEVIKILTTKYRFNVNLLTPLLGAAATRDNMLAAAVRIHQQAGPNDAVLIYFAGHGVYDPTGDKYYLVASDSKLADYEAKTYASLVDLSAVCGRFKKYHNEANKKCRDLLVVLDACYSGGALEGWGGSQHSEFFSRYILTSTLTEDLAPDGLPGRGSAFSNAFVNALEANDKVFYSFALMAPVFESKFTSSDPTLKVDETQSIAFGNIPEMQTGRGSFIFEKKDQDKPDLVQLKESLIEHLDFTEQRGDVEDIYQQKISQLNIITTQGHSFNVQRLLAKVIFRELSKLSKVEFASGHCYARERVNLDLDPSSDVWRHLHRQIKDDKLRDDKETIHNWFFDKLLSDEKDIDGKRHVVLWITLSLAGDGIFQSIEQFCQEFSAIFLRTFAALTPDEQKKRGKMFIVIADEREQAADSHKDLLKSIVGNKLYNFIPTRKIKDINNNHARKWLNSFPDENVSKKILLLKDDKVYEACIGVQPFRYEDFIQKVCVHCVFSSSETEELHAYLYDFNNNALF